MNVHSVISEKLRDTDTALESSLIDPENLLVAFKFAALWDRESPDPVDGPAWSPFFERPLAQSAAIVAVKASDFREAAVSIAPPENQDKVREASLVLAKEVSKLQDLINLFAVVGLDHDERGHDDKVYFATTFEVLLDYAERIRKASETAWDIVVEPYKRTDDAGTDHGRPQ